MNFVDSNDVIFMMVDVVEMCEIIPSSLEEGLRFRITEKQ